MCVCAAQGKGRGVGVSEEYSEKVTTYQCINKHE